jgi:hypothetical protein
VVKANHVKGMDCVQPATIKRTKDQLLCANVAIGKNHTKGMVCVSIVAKKIISNYARYAEKTNRMPVAVCALIVF